MIQISKLSGKSYSDEVSRNIFQPLPASVMLDHDWNLPKFIQTEDEVYCHRRQVEDESA